MNRKERTIFVTIIINGLLVSFKFWLAAASGSLALRSSAMHSVADMAIGVFVLAGLFISRRESTKAHANRGLGLVENAVALVVSLAIFYIGFDIVREVLVGETQELRNLVPITFAALVTVAVAYVTARYKLFVGRQTGSPALIASGYHSQVDIYASIVVVAGLGGAALGLPNLDTAAAAVVAVLIFLSGFQIGASALAALRRHRLLNLEGESGEPVQPPRSWWRVYGSATGALLVLLYLVSGFFTVQPEENAVVRRFGVIVDQAGPGLHYRWPTPIGRVDRVAVDQVRRLETSPTQMLAGDLNLVSVRASVHYSVIDPVAFLVNIATPEQLVKQTVTAALRQIVAQETVDALLTVDKVAIQDRALEAAQALLQRNSAGIRIVAMQLLESAPPPEVADAFRDVASAREDRNTFVNEASAYRNEVIPMARGNAEKARQVAVAYSAEKIAVATAAATSFRARQKAYAGAPQITRLRMYLEAVERSFPGARKLVIDPGISPQTTDIWIARSANSQLFPPMP